MPTTTTTAVKPFMVYQGGKRKMLPHLRNNLPATFRNYYEPFLGGGALALDLLSRSDASEHKFFLSDYSSEVVAVWQSVKEEPEELARLIEKFLTQHCEGFFYSIRNWDREGTLNYRSRVERAARFIYLQQTNFGGITSSTAEGFSRASYAWKFNTPLGHSRYDFRNLFAVSELLNQNDTTIFQASYEEAIADASWGDLIYLDPPYEEGAGDEDRTHKISSAYLGASPVSHENIRRHIDERTTAGSMVLLSNSDTGLIRNLYKGWAHVRPDYRWAINGRETPPQEIIIANWRLADRLASERMGA